MDSCKYEKKAGWVELKGAKKSEEEGVGWGRGEKCGGEEKEPE